MGCLRRGFVPRPPHRLQQESRAWLSDEIPGEQVVPQERHRPTMARSPPLADLSRPTARCLPVEGAECLSHVSPAYESRSSQLLVCHIFNAPSAANLISILVGIPWLRSLLRACWRRGMMHVDFHSRPSSTGQGRVSVARLD